MQIGRALEAGGLSGYDVEILFQNGQAVLRGTVATPQQVAIASRIAQSVPGVQSVANQLRPGQMPAQQGPPQGNPRYAMAGYQAPAGAPLTPGVAPGVPVRVDRLRRPAQVVLWEFPSRPLAPRP